jgi:hypothetical protein
MAATPRPTIVPAIISDRALTLPNPMNISPNVTKATASSMLASVIGTL